MKFQYLLPFLIALLFASSQDTQAAITVNGIADEDIESNEATFSVPSESGFTIVAKLDGQIVPLDTDIDVVVPGYYELAVTKTDNTNGSEEMDLIQFIVRDTERGTSERGLINWIPYPTLDSAPEAFAGSTLEVIAPAKLPQGMNVPVIARVRDASGKGARLNGTMRIADMPDNRIRILRGFGSGFLPAPADAGVMDVAASLSDLSQSNAVEIESSTTWTTVDADITSDTDWGENARIHITSDITSNDGVTLTIGAGSIVQIAPGVDIEVDGVLMVNGTTANPVFFTPEPGATPWGGFLLQGSGEAYVKGAIFTGSGADDNWFDNHSGYSTHRDEQATFLFDETTIGEFTDCFFIDLPGQALHGKDAIISLTDCLIQRLPTVGQFNGGSVSVTRSALIEFPLHDNIFNDNDNDGIYFTVGTHELIDSIIGWAKDDGVDAGSGDSGRVTVTGCWFEACFHEGMAWSGGGRTAIVSNSVAINCGQGIESGWSTGLDSPIVNVTNSLCIGNHVGWRFGDNYDWDYDGELNVSNSISLFNDRNIWGFEWDSWNYRLERMTIENNFLSVADDLHPTNTVWDGVTNASLLEPFVSGSSTAAGVGFGEWEFQKNMSEYGEPVTVSLSEFTTVEVNVNYEIASDHELLAMGSLQFTPGELRKTITPPSLVNFSGEYVRVTLTSAEGGDFTTPRSVFYVGSPDAGAGPQTLITAGSEWNYLDDGSDQGTAWRELDFDDSTWSTGAAQLGYGDDDEATVINSGPDDNFFPATYFRHSLSIGNPAEWSSLDMRLVRDDGAIVYLNGVEVFRSNMPEGAVAFDDFAESTTPSGSENDFREVTIPATFLQAGENVIAIEVHQANATSSDLSFDFELLANPAQPSKLFLVDAGGELSVVWQADIGVFLQASDTLHSDWIDLPEATSPFTISGILDKPKNYFRLAR